MLTEIQPYLRTPVAAPGLAEQSALQRVVNTGLLRCALPPRLGGNGGALADLALAATQLMQRDVLAAHVLWAQRMAIEAMVQSSNVGLRELWLPDFLSGTRAGTLAPGAIPLNGQDSGRGWLLNGTLHDVPNLPWEGFSLVTPVRLGDGPTDWVLLRSEEEGLSVQASAVPHAPDLVTLVLHQVFFREDEWLGESDLPERMVPVAQALASCHPLCDQPTPVMKA